MTPRSLLVALLFAFATLLATFAVVGGGYGLATAVQDALLARALRTIAVGCLLLLAVDAVLMLLVLAIRAVAEERRPVPRDRPEPDADESR